MSAPSLAQIRAGFARNADALRRAADRLRLSGAPVAPGGYTLIQLEASIRVYDDLSRGSAEQIREHFAESQRAVSARLDVIYAERVKPCAS